MVQFFFFRINNSISATKMSQEHNCSLSPTLQNFLFFWNKIPTPRASHDAQCLMQSTKSQNPCEQCLMQNLCNRKTTLKKNTKSTLNQTKEASLYWNLFYSCLGTSQWTYILLQCVKPTLYKLHISQLFQHHLNKICQKLSF